MLAALARATCSSRGATRLAALASARNSAFGIATSLRTSSTQGSLPPRKAAAEASSTPEGAAAAAVEAAAAAAASPRPSKRAPCWACSSTPRRGRLAARASPFSETVGDSAVPAGTSCPLGVSFFGEDILSPIERRGESDASFFWKGFFVSVNGCSSSRRAPLFFFYLSFRRPFLSLFPRASLSHPGQGGAATSPQSQKATVESSATESEWRGERERGDEKERASEPPVFFCERRRRERDDDEEKKNPLPLLDLETKKQPKKRGLKETPTRLFSSSGVVETITLED